MGWDAKGNGGNRYFYRSERRPGRPHPVKVYVGKGPGAEEAARQLEGRRQARLARREADRAALLSERAGVAAADGALRELEGLVNEVVRAALRGAGYHEHRGEWRRRRHGQDGRSDRGR